MSRVIIVDENDSIISAKERAEIGPNDIYRVSALWLVNTNREVLMAQRAFTKKKDPGAWGPAVAGTIEEGETYETNIVKEMGEEIGVPVSIEELTKGPHMRIHKAESAGYFLQWFTLVRDIPADAIRIAPDEVAKVGWFSKERLGQFFAEHPEQFTPAAGQWLPAFLER